MLEEYLAVYPDSTCKVFDSKENALNSAPLFVAECFIHSNYSLLTDPDRKKYGFKIVDANNDPFKINCDGWSVTSIIKYFYYDSHTEVKIASPDGEIRMIDTKEWWNSLESIANLQTLINQFRGFKDWTYYELKVENSKLKEEIKAIRLKIEELGLEQDFL